MNTTLKPSQSKTILNFLNYTKDMACLFQWPKYCGKMMMAKILCQDDDLVQMRKNEIIAKP